MFEKKIGLKIKGWREALKITQTEFGKKIFGEDAPRPQSMVSKIEKGKRTITFEEACIITTFFGKSLNDLNPFHIVKIKNIDDEMFLKLHAVFNFDRKGPGLVLKKIIDLFYSQTKKERVEKEISHKKKIS